MRDLRGYKLEKFVPPRDPAELPAAKRRLYERAAREVIDTWLRWMRENPTWLDPNKPGRESYCDVVAKGPPTTRTWLKALAMDSGVMHDSCDANMVFDEALRNVGLIKGDPDEDEMTDEETDVWNDVTYNYGFLERAAANALKKAPAGRKAAKRKAAKRKAARR